MSRLLDKPTPQTRLAVQQMPSTLLQRESTAATVTSCSHLSVVPLLMLLNFHPHHNFESPVSILQIWRGEEAKAWAQYCPWHFYSEGRPWDFTSLENKILAIPFKRPALI